ncbi:MAG TPA: phosphatase PAP2 family protein [Blastocatellia bacterium]|nr:phosphatase PAP2 family protein [Blastocatellia bacterium]
MKPQWVTLGILLTLAVALTLAAARFAYLPGDVSVTRFVQSLAGKHVGWAQAATTSARSPWNFLVLAVSVVVSWWLAGWRGVLAAAISFGGMWLLGDWLKEVVRRPRPAASLVRVVGASSGYSYPSTFALTYGSTVGYLAVLAFYRRAGKLRSGLLLVCGLILLIGGAARVVLGAHWPSDVLGAYLISLVWAALLVQLIHPSRKT